MTEPAGTDWTLPALVGAIGTVLGGIGTWFLGYRKQVSDDEARKAEFMAKEEERKSKLVAAMEKAEDDRADESYRDVIKLLTAELLATKAETKAELKVIRDDHLECVEQHSACEERVKQLSNHLVAVDTRVTAVEQKTQ